MKIRIELRVADRDGNRRACSLPIALPVTVSTFGDIARSYETAVAGLTNGYIVGGSASITYQNAVGIPSIGSNALQSLLVVGRAGSDYSSIIIPSPATDLPYDGIGAYEGIRIAPEGFGIDARLQALVAFLSGSVNPDGAPFAAEQFVAGLMRDVE